MGRPNSSKLKLTQVAQPPKWAQTGEPGRPYDVVKYRAGAVGTAQQSGREVRSPALPSPRLHPNLSRIPRVPKLPLKRDEERGRERERKEKQKKEKAEKEQVKEKARKRRAEYT